MDSSQVQFRSEILWTDHQKRMCYRFSHRPHCPWHRVDKAPDRQTIMFRDHSMIQWLERNQAMIVEIPVFLLNEQINRRSNHEMHQGHHRFLNTIFFPSCSNEKFGRQGTTEGRMDPHSSIPTIHVVTTIERHAFADRGTTSFPLSASFESLSCECIAVCSILSESTFAPMSRVKAIGIGLFSVCVSFRSISSPYSRTARCNYE
jgi:hypothetical protein